MANSRLEWWVSVEFQELKAHPKTTICTKSKRSFLIQIQNDKLILLITLSRGKKIVSNFKYFQVGKKKSSLFHIYVKFLVYLCVIIEIKTL